MRTSGSIVFVSLQRKPQPPDRFLGVIYIRIVMTAQVIIRTEIRGIATDCFRHLLTKKNMLAGEIISYAQRFGIVSFPQAANRTVRVVLRDRQYSLPEIPSGCIEDVIAQRLVRLDRIGWPGESPP